MWTSLLLQYWWPCQIIACENLYLWKYHRGLSILTHDNWFSPKNCHLPCSHSPLFSYVPHVKMEYVVLYDIHNSKLPFCWKHFTLNLVLLLFKLHCKCCSKLLGPRGEFLCTSVPLIHANNSTLYGFVANSPQMCVLRLI